MSIFVWVVVAVILAILEIVTVGFFCLFFALGAACAAISSIFTDDMNLQMGVFLISSILFLVFGRPMVKKAFQVSDKPVPTNSDKLVGEEVLVLEKVTRYGGRVKVLHTGEVWSAYVHQAEGSGPDEIEEGAEGIVSRVDGAKLVIQPAPARSQE